MKGQSASRNKSFYQPELDCLRFAAFLGVFLYHCVPEDSMFYKTWPHLVFRTLVATLTSGAYGVPLFFALSSYLITNLLLREKQTTGHLDARSFYVRRILRIWPLYFTFLIIASLIPRFVHSQHLPASYVWGFILLAGNWVCALLGDPSSVAGPLWSVSIEEQFYLTWPLVVRTAARRSMAAIAVAILVVANASRVLFAYIGASDHFIAYNTMSCLDPIAVGILLALIFEEPPTLASRERLSLFCGSVTVMIAAAALANHFHRWGKPAARCLVAFACAGVLVSFLGSQGRWMRNSALIYLGKISYGLYVFHLLAWLCADHILGHTREQTLAGRLEIAALALAITIGLAALSYRWLESPFLQLKERFTHVRSRPVWGSGEEARFSAQTGEPLRTAAASLLPLEVVPNTPKVQSP